MHYSNKMPNKVLVRTPNYVVLRLRRTVWSLYSREYTYGGSMKNYDEMYQKFNLSEENRIQFKTMSDSEYSKSTRVATLSVETTVNDNGNEHIEKKEVIDAKLV